MDEKVDRGWIDVSSWTGRSLNRLPNIGREPGESWAYISNLITAIGDRWCDPRSGGIADVRSLAGIYGVGIQQFQRNILPYLDYMRWLGDVPVTNQNSAYADAALYRPNVAQTWRSNLGLSMGALGSD